MAEPATATGEEEEGIDAVLAFWFVENGPEQWFEVDSAFDGAIRARFGALHERAAAGGLAHWRESARGALAEIIVLDQLSRNLHRGDRHTFACDAMALQLAKEALAKGYDRALGEAERAFLYLPFEHSEAAADQETSVQLYAELGDRSYLEWAKKHKAVIDRFGRYPHRNALLGRESTPEELAFLDEDGSSF